MNSKKISFMIPYHRFSIEQLLKLVSSLPFLCKIIVTYRKELPSEYAVFCSNYEFIETVDVSIYEKCVDVSSDSDLLMDVLDSVFFDVSTPLIWERGVGSAKKNFFGFLLGRSKESFHKGSLKIIQEINNSINMISSLQPSFLFFQSAPHTLRSWVDQKVAEKLGIPVYGINRCTMPGFYQIINLSELPYRHINIGGLRDNEKVLHGKSLEDYRYKVSSSYAEAQPKYERDRFDRNKGKYVNHKYLLRKHWYAPSRYINTILCWSRLKKLSKSFDAFKNKKYVVFFLHYQPERTTVPEGGVFGIQLNAVMMLRSILPEDVSILVKEHPSTFTNFCDPLVRDPQFYSKFASFAGVHWVDIETDNFELIDSSILTGTITGTVGLESLLRGVPSIFFGKPYISKCYGCFRYGLDEKFSEFIDRVVNHYFHPKAVSESVDKVIEEEKFNSFMSNNFSESDKYIDGLIRYINSTI